jgi:hypothetical protein
MKALMILEGEQLNLEVKNTQNTREEHQALTQESQNFTSEVFLQALGE